MPSLLDIAKINAAGGLADLLDEAARPTPELTGRYVLNGQEFQSDRIGSARTIRGTQYKTLIRTGLPSASFRDANQGTTASQSSWETRLFEAFLMEVRFECDKGIADASEDGPAAYLAIEAAGMLTGAFMHLARQFYYGRSYNDSKGFPGLIEMYDATNMVVDAGGTANNTASSVWAVKFSPMDVQWVLGGDGQLQVSDVRIESLPDPNDSSKRFTAYVQTLVGWVGLQVRTPHAVGRIKNLTEEQGKGLTDVLLGRLLAKFPTGWAPDAFFLSRRSLEQLRASRTATNATGAEAPTPTTFEGIPLIPTDAIRNNETLTM